MARGRLSLIVVRAQRQQNFVNNKQFTFSSPFNDTMDTHTRCGALTFCVGDDGTTFFEVHITDDLSALLQFHTLCLRVRIEFHAPGCLGVRFDTTHLVTTIPMHTMGCHVRRGGFDAHQSSAKSAKGSRDGLAYVLIHEGQ